MRILPFSSIRSQLILLGIASSSVALVFFAAGDFFNVAHVIRKANLHKLEAQATMLGVKAKDSLLTHDAASGARLLQSLRLDPTINGAYLYDAEGKILASYHQDDSVLVPPDNPPMGLNLRPDGRWETVQPILDDGKRIGLICVQQQAEEHAWGVKDYFETFALVLACSFAASLVLSVLLQRAISGPVMRLADATKAIADGGDYSIRVHGARAGELGELYASFNKMLDAIEASNAALQESRDLLEQRVKDRTADLQAEIAQKERVQADLVRAKEAAEAADAAKSQFLANMSHEIRTPLNGILGFTKLLLQNADHDDPATRQEFLEVIRSSGEHLLELINDILDLSKIESKQMAVERIACSPCQIVAEVVSMLRVRSEEKGLKLETTWVGAIPSRIWTDPSRLRQLLMNLVGNAIKFTDSGAVEILSRLIERDGRPQLEFNVIDTGIGIPAEKQETIFDPFVQADASVTRRFGGTGLGLAISRRIAHALGGELTVESRVGEGSTFTATIDVGSLEGVSFFQSPLEAVSAPRARRRPDGQAVSLDGSKILLVEDGDTNRKLIELVLGRAGAEIVSAENGRTGSDLALRQSFDLILMDMQMPVMDGYTATRLLRDRGLTLPILALTAHAMSGDEDKCREAGCTGFLAKPIDPDSLLEAVRKVLTEECRPRPVAPCAAAESAGSDQPLISTLPADDPEFLEIIEQFVERLREKLDAMQRASVEGDFAALAEAAHWLKGAGGTAGFPAFTQPAAALVHLARAGDAEGVSELLRELAAMCRRIVVAAPAAAEPAAANAGPP